MTAWCRAVVALLVLALLPVLVVPSASASTLFEDGFEAGDHSQWTTQVGADGSAVVQSDVVRSGVHAARLSATSATGSYASMRRSLPAPQTSLTAQVAVTVLQEGASGGNVPLLRLLDASGQRLVSVVRQNATGGKVYAQHSGTTSATTGVLPQGTWRVLVVTVVADGGASTVEVRLDGAVVHRTTTATLSAPVSAVQVGNEVRAQPFVAAVDDVQLATPVFGGGDGSCDRGAPPPTTSDPGEVVVADGFEDPTLPKWTRAVRQGDAVVEAQPSVFASGRCSLRISVTSTWDSRGYLEKGLPVDTAELWLDGRFQVTGESPDQNWNVPTFRLMSNGKRVFDVSRQNVTGNLFVRFPKVGGGWSFLQTGRRLALGRWYQLKIRLQLAGNLSQATVWLDGGQVLAPTTVTLGVPVLDALLVGAEHQSQIGEVYADDVVVKAVPAPPRGDVDFSDGFESGGLGAWTTSTTGDGTAVAQSEAVVTGGWAGRLSSPSTSSGAQLRIPLAAARPDLTATASVQATAEGAKGSVTPLVTLLDAGGAPLVVLQRVSGSGALLVRHSGASSSTGSTLPLGAWRRASVRAVASGAGQSSVEVHLDGTRVHATSTASLGTFGTRTVQVGGSGAVFGLLVDDASAVRGSGGPPVDPDVKLLVADHLGKRLLILDLQGRVVWSFDNPTGSANYEAGPLGVRWMPGNRILATFGTGEVGEIDVATKTWVWRTKGYGGEAFQSPYDAELLPDGRLAVALRFNNGGRISVYDRVTGQEVWRHLLSNAHAVHFRTAEQSWASDDPTLLVGGWGSIREVSYRGTAAQAVTWQVKSEYTHDAIVLEDDRLLTTEGYYVQKIERSGAQVWKRSTPDENRRIAVNPTGGGGYVYTVAESDRIEFRDVNGHLLRDFSRLSDGSGLDYPYGLAVIRYPG